MVSTSTNDRDGRAELAGITWDHPRGLWPLLAATSAYASVPGGVKVRWETRTLQDFADVGIDELARSYDLVVIDHPHVGEVAASQCLVPLDEVIGSDELAQLSRSVGRRQPRQLQL